MLSEPLIIQDIMNKVNLLSPKDRLYLIQLTCESLTRETVAEKFNRPLQFGEFVGGKFSTWEDFKIAEWRPTDEHLNDF
jgi:hypothetical protein